MMATQCGSHWAVLLVVVGGSSDMARHSCRGCRVVVNKIKFK